MSGNGPGGGRIQRLLTIVSVAIIALWAWKFFAANPQNASSLFTRGRTQSMLLIGIIGFCVAYLLWRFLSFFFWKKYFDE